MATDHYRTLGVERMASTDAIKAAYRKLARKYHPDLNPNDPEANRKFQAINEANEVLSDPETRKKYDRWGDQWKHATELEQAERERGQRTEGGAFTGGGGRTRSGEQDYSDLFGDLFGGSDGRRVRFRGQDLRSELHLDLREAYTSHQRTLSVNGKAIRITIPAGVENGQTIRIPGQGGPGMNGGPAGDLYLTFVVPDDPRFKRVGADLFTTVDLDLYTALLGGELMLETLAGTVKLKVPTGTANGTKVKLKGKGFPRYKQEGHFGDLYVTYAVKLPTELSEQERALFTELAALRKRH